MSTDLYDALDRVDSILDTGPDRVEFEAELAPLLEDSTVRQYFFERVDGVVWLEHLSQHKAFWPRPDDGHWPQSNFLLRMAESAPRNVAEILSDVLDAAPATVLSRSIDIISRLPGDIAAQFIDPLAELLADAEWERRATDIARITESVIVAGENGGALRLFKTLIKLQQPDEGYQSRPASVVRPWQYENILDEHLWSIFRAKPVKTWRLLCNVLEAGINATADAERTSSHWRSAIEDHDQNEPLDPADLLLEAIRDGAIHLSENGLVELEDIIDELELRELEIFRRLALHLVRVCATEGANVVRRYIVDADLFSSTAFHHEYYLLLQDRFHELDDTDQSQVFGFIDNEVDPERAREMLGRFEEEPVQDSRIEHYIEYRKMRRLHALRDSLGPERKAELNGLIDKHGEPEHPEFLTYSYGVRAGPGSPTSASELSEMPVPELIDYLSQAPEDVDGMGDFSTLGLSRELSAAVADSPEQYAEEALRFQTVRPIFVGSLLSGLGDASSDEMSFPWRPVIELCSRILQQDYHYDARGSSYPDKSGDWSMTRREMAGLLSDALRPESANPPFELRVDIWRLLSALLRDPDPKLDSMGSSDLDPATESINTTRGKALHATFRYCWWVQRTVVTDGGGNFNLTALVPEATEELEWHLDTEQDAALSTRAVYGQWFPSVSKLDRRWAENHLDDIFPTSEVDEPYWRTAWTTYLTFWPVGEPTFGLLHDQYRLAIQRLIGQSDEQTVGGLADARKKLAAHVMRAYWLGLLEEYEDDDLIDEFWRIAGVELRLEAINYVARSLSASEGEVPEKILGRLRAFWMSRLQSAEADEDDRARREMEGFVKWFTSGAFDPEWAVVRLERSLEVATSVPEFPVQCIKELANVVEKWPQDVFRCLELLAEGEFAVHAIRSELDASKRIIATARASGGPELQSRAADLLDELARRGLIDELRDIS